MVNLYDLLYVAYAELRTMAQRPFSMDFGLTVITVVFSFGSPFFLR